jgi:dihydroflavonol-4-reductase
MRIFITGATGFIGTHLIRKLAMKGHELHCLARRNSITRQIEEVGASIVIGDVTDRDSLIEGMRKCDWVANLANIYTFWEPDKSIYRKVNVEGTRNVMESALETGVSKVLHVSTSLIFGRPADIPFHEDSPVGPVRFSEYAQTKYEGDLIAWELFEKKGLPLVVIYPGMVVGPGNTRYGAQLVRNLIEQRMPVRGLEKPVNGMSHVTDVAEVIVRALEKEDNIGEKYLVGQQISMGEFNRLVSDISGVPMPKICLPDFVVVLNALFLTLLADTTKKPPLWGLSKDMVRTASRGQAFNGSKVERELGIQYHSIREALEEEIASYTY